MRINNNLMAMNTHRQLGIAGEQGAKSMGKLSSGMRINSAADDAAGLAISEKMRGQIRGLNQASKNSQDGISMIQTAEGALGETQAILQRMRELAVQSANDTNVDVDRSEIQKEMQQLTSEINRIGNTTEFNTKKVLNGGGEVKEVQTNTMQKGSAAGAMKGSEKLTAVADKAAVWDTGALTGGTSGTDSTGAFEFNGVKVNITYDSGTGGTTAGAVGAIDANAKTVELTLGTGTAAPSAEVVAVGIAKALTDYKADASTTELADFASFEGAAGGVKITGVEAAGAKNNGVVATATDVSGLAAAGSQLTTAGVTKITEGSTSIPVTTKTTSKAAVAAEWGTGAIGQLGADASASITFAGVTINMTASAAAATGAAEVSDVNEVGASLKINKGTTDSAAKNAQEIAKAFNAVKDSQGATGSLKNFTIEAVGDGIKITGTKADGADNNDNTVTVAGDASLSLTTTGSAQTAGSAGKAGVTEVRGEYTFEIEDAFEKEGVTLNIGGKELKGVASNAKAADGEFNIGGNAEEQAISIAAALNADATLSARFDALVDGGKITLKEKELKATGVAVDKGMVVGPTNDAVQGKVSFTLDESVAVGGRYSVGGTDIEVTDNANHKGIADGTAVLFSADTKQQTSNLANAMATNTTLKENFEIEASGNRITLTQKEGKESMKEATVETGTNKGKDFKATLQVGANSGQGMEISVGDMRSLALGVSGKEATSDATAKNGVKASYVKAADVSNGTDSTAVEFALDVSTHEKAQAAVSVINDAIEKVSAQRSDLGAFQNRLEHTIKNLDTSSENLQAAESRVRDVDMAKEIMTNTKNNILQQAAQAMLAQANQAPQAVLQLLR